jgi:hypothetical protein
MVLAYPAIGRMVESMSEGRDTEEWRKRVTAKLIQSPDYILIDNIRRKLDSSALASAITSGVWEDRILGKTQTVRIKVRCAWIATGNNPRLSSEMARRTVRIRLNTKTEMPWKRDKNIFRHPQLLEWVQNHRGKLICAILTLVQAWIAKGCPVPENLPILGMFEKWCKVMGGILSICNISGFLGNLEEFYVDSDEDGEVRRSFIGTWWENHQQQDVGVKELFALIGENDIPIDFGRGSEQSQKIRLGKYLSNLRDMQVGRFRIVPRGTKYRAQQWKLEEVRIKKGSEKTIEKKKELLKRRKK